MIYKYEYSTPKITAHYHSMEGVPISWMTKEGIIIITNIFDYDI